MASIDQVDRLPSGLNFSGGRCNGGVTVWILVAGPGDEAGLSLATILERLLMVGAGGLYTATMLALTAPLRRPSRRAAEGQAAVT
jgi:energy-converting hydrogenase Eha subunit B